MIITQNMRVWIVVDGREWSMRIGSARSWPKQGPDTA
jgi:hypothetical protein